MDRLIIAHTPLPAHQLLFRSLSGEERLAGLFEFDVELLSPDNRLDLKSLLGQKITLELRGNPMAPRYLNGNITRMTLSGREAGGNRYYIYRAVLRPTLWYLTQNRDFRIYQEKTVPDILTQVLGQYQVKIDNRLSYDYRIWGYCVQYQESDFDFISRLMEHEGIYYYFTHQQDGHTLVLADAPAAHQELAGYASIPYQLAEGGLVENKDNINSWSVSDAITPSLYSLDDYDFRKPRARLLEARQNPASFAQDKAEVFDWPGRYTDHAHGQFYVKVRQQEFEAQHEQMSGEGSSQGIAPGYRFQLIQAPRMEDNRAYLVVSARYFMQENSYASNDNDVGEQHTEFQVVPADINWRPARTTPWPKTHGPQTAEVVGPEGESIWTDKYGRVKLKFRWDRHGSGNETSSCWVRVSSAWAGWKYGGIQIPRVGEEVVVDFINGDPDRPIITGRVYNEDSMPPWDLPGDATKMGFMSRSKGGGVDNASFLFLEDSPGNESFDMHAERNMNMTVENDKNVNIDGSRFTRIGKTQDHQVIGNATFLFGSMRNTTVTGPETATFNSGQQVGIKAGRKFTIHDGGDNVNITGDQTILLKGNRHHTIENKQTQLIKQGQDTTIEQYGQSTKIETGDKKLEITSGNQSTKLAGGNKSLDITGNLTSTVSGEETRSQNKLTVTTATDYVQKASKIKIATVDGEGPSGSDIYIHGNKVTVKSDSEHIIIRPKNMTWTKWLDVGIKTGAAFSITGGLTVDVKTAAVVKFEPQFILYKKGPEADFNDLKMTYCSIRLAIAILTSIS
ncbi:type VI secretion system Vgr family protein [Serratia ureilytica]|uniref:type VI secretion system Vgr family protein n=1 Tax=Serratia ureilytica TaxID=300181 RepID=UPI001E3DC101|nr:type VI secretion system tip protein TssI/VgrG [Serratia ureilytica]